MRDVVVGVEFVRQHEVIEPWQFGGEACVVDVRELLDMESCIEAMSEVLASLAVVEEQMGGKLGDPERPLLVSVRSGARASMPGMLDTVLNLGLNEAVVAGLAKALEADATVSGVSQHRASRSMSRSPSVSKSSESGRV